MDIRSFLSNYLTESERSMGILGGALLDDLLEQLLRSVMIVDTPDNLFRGFGPLSTFSGKIDTAYAFGLISTSERDDFHRIRKIRNECAHSLSAQCSFEESPIRDHIQQLKLSRSSLIAQESRLQTDFESTLMVLTGFLESRIESATHANVPPSITTMSNSSTQ